MVCDSSNNIPHRRRKPRTSASAVLLLPTSSAAGFLVLLLLLLSSGTIGSTTTAVAGSVGIGKTLSSSSSSSSLFNISVIGLPINVWCSVDTLNQCGIIDVPDIPARAYTDNHGSVHIIDGSTHYHEMIGLTLLNVERSCDISWDMTGDSDPAQYAGNEFLDSTFAFDNGTVVALIHTEYPGDNYDNCDGPNYPYCWTVSIGLAVSYNWGTTWEHYLPPPHHLIAAVPYKYNQTQLASGWGDPSNILLNPKNDYYYFAIWNRHQVGIQKSGICIVQNTGNLLNPKRWKGWDGYNYTIEFVSPYTMDDDDSPENHICTTIANIPSNCAALGLNWSIYLDMFVMTLGCFGSMGRDFYITTSDDLITWTDPQEFYSKDDMPEEVQKNVTSINYPVFMDPNATTDHNFYNIGSTPYLFWVSLGHSPYTDGRSLWATPMEFTRIEDDDDGIGSSGRDGDDGHQNNNNDKKINNENKEDGEETSTTLIFTSN